MKQITTIGLDLAKQVFRFMPPPQMAVRSSTASFASRSAAAFREAPACLVGMEACGSAHYWAREIRALGHDVRLIPPVFVKPFVKRGKTDAAMPKRSARR